ncbi:MAG: pilus assembly protein PilM [Kurthia sp.]|nr:pilus assembly protein PilM [Candidatus Kurthia equi]
MNSGKMKCLSIIYNDFMLSLLATKQDELEKGLTYQIPLKEGIVKNGLIQDEDAFFYELKDLLKKLKIKKHVVRVVSPSHNTLTKKIRLPETLETSEEMKEYVNQELNESIQLPFTEPIIDLFDENPTDGEVLLFAAEHEEVDTIIRIIEDLGMIPDTVDIKSLVDLRVLSDIIPKFNEDTLVVLDWSMDELRMSIVEKGHVELLKAFRIETTHDDWTLEENEDGIVSFALTNNKSHYEQEIARVISEIDKAVHFYQFSLNKGSKEVQRVLNIGDHPMLSKITEILKDEVPLPVEELTNEEVDAKFPTYFVKHSTLLGLTMKGVSHE